MLNVAFHYSSLWQFSFNALKSAIVIFGKNITPTQHKWKLGEESIPINDKYKHLSIIQQSRQQSIDRTTVSCNTGRKTYFAIMNNLSKNTNPFNLISLYRKIVIPTLLYRYELWKNLKQFSTFCDKGYTGFKNIKQI